MKEAFINLILNAIQAIKLKNNGNQNRKIDINSEYYRVEDTLRDVTFGEATNENSKNVQHLDRSEVVIEAGEPCILITVQDSGIGIKSDNLKRIFNPFFTTAVQGGTGLGLSMVKRTINAHGGIIKVTSDSGKGTLFNIYLPVPDNNERDV
jgi:signal transduction histidine kinase